MLADFYTDVLDLAGQHECHEVRLVPMYSGIEKSPFCRHGPWTISTAMARACDKVCGCGIPGAPTGLYFTIWRCGRVV